MTLIASSQSIASHSVQFVNEHGKFPAIVVEGIEQGTCDLVALGAPALGPAKDGEKPRRVGAQFFAAVPYGQKGREGRNSLYPYWEEA